jgi:hypothetical protein
MDDAPTNQQITTTTKKRVCQEVKTRDRERSHAHVATDHRGPSSEERGRGGKKREGGRTPDTKGKGREEMWSRPTTISDASGKVSSSGQISMEACVESCSEQHHAAGQEQAGSGSHGRLDGAGTRVVERLGGHGSRHGDVAGVGGLLSVRGL